MSPGSLKRSEIAHFPVDYPSKSDVNFKFMSIDFGFLGLITDPR